MEVLARTGNENLATVYIARFDDERYIEFVESVQPPLPKLKKWVLIVSTLFGCPVKCRFCDCSDSYKGKLSKEQLISQIDYLVTKEFPDRIVPVEKFKIQFARMGEPALNNAVLDVLEELPKMYDAPGLMPSISTIAPANCEHFFERLTDIKNRFYSGKFQLQFSIHSTNKEKRDWLIPVNKWDLKQISEYGESYFRPGDRKITLNFALADGFEVIPGELIRYFNPDKFAIKITPVNPTIKAHENSFVSYSEPNKEIFKLKDKLNETGYDVIISFGENEENIIGSNCGMYVMNYLKSQVKIENSYTHPVIRE